MTRVVRCYVCFCFALITLSLDVGVAGADAGKFTRLTPIDVKIINAAPAFPGGGYNVENILPSSGRNARVVEYASDHQAARTFIDFDLGRPQKVAAFRHVQRRTPDTVAEANLVFSETPDFARPLGTVKVAHVDKPGATTLATFPPVLARYVRWQVTSVLPGRSPNVGGQVMELFAAGDVDATPSGIGVSAHVLPIIERAGNRLSQSLKLAVQYPYAEACQARVQVNGQKPRDMTLKFGHDTLEYVTPATDVARSLEVRFEISGQHAVTRTIQLPPARRLTVYILPHSHTDIGYTGIQTDIEEKQVNNLLQGLAAARRTAEYPEGARFVWNVEVLWAADLYLRRLPAAYREEFFQAVRSGQIALNGMYLNELTGLCRPEELTQLFRFATQLGHRTGVPIDAAMISDVPGYTWGTVTAMNQAGIKYFSVAPNYFDRIGRILVDWENKPFWWVGPDGTSKVLVWIPFWGYAMSHRYGKMSAGLVEDFCEGLLAGDYPYDIAYVRWAGHGDNAVPDPAICDFVKEWNAKHASPHFVISSTSDAFRAFERRYGDRLPRVRGDWTPYWEDGAGSSAAETAMNRASSDRLAQAQTLWALLAPQRFPVTKFEDAWRNVLLYSEHTWGAYCSISQPANPFTSDQWNIKQSYALTANLQSRQLLDEAAQSGEGFQASDDHEYVDIFNTSSWCRTDVALISNEVASGHDSVVDEQGKPVPAQRLASNELAVLVRDLGPYVGRRLVLKQNAAVAPDDGVKIAGNIIENGHVRVRLDEKTGGIVELTSPGIDTNLADVESGDAINDYLYLIGDDVATLQRSGPVRITVRDRGPLVGSLLVESDAPGCHRLRREIRLVAGSDCVKLIDTVDKKRLAAANYHDKEGKESVNFAFPFNVPDGQLRLDIPYGVIRPEYDQMPSACKNWLSVGRWADVSNKRFGVTWVTLDAPLVQVGGITATLLNSQTDPHVWRKTIEPTQKLYSWAMNNHWGTNYRAYQEGPVVFRFVLRPHAGPCNDAAAARIATGFSQPLVAVPGRGTAPRPESLVRIEPADVIVTGLKPSDDGKAIILRLLSARDQAVDATFAWAQPGPTQTWLSDTSERPKKKVGNTVRIPARSMVTLRADLPE